MKRRKRCKNNPEEDQCRLMMHDHDTYPSEIPFKSRFLDNIVEYHCRGKANVRTGRFRWERNDKNHEMRVLYFEKTKNVWNSISWLNCVKKYHSKSKKMKVLIPHVATNKERIEAMRDEVFDMFRKNFVMSKGAYKPGANSNWRIPECPKCGLKDISFNVDHDSKMFCELRDSFLKKYNLNLDDIKVGKKGYVWVMTDTNQASSWKTYHNTSVDYQIMCPDCHKTKTKQDICKINCKN